MKPGVAGVTIPHIEETMREVMGVPVVVRVRPMTALEAHRIWQCFTGAPAAGPRVLVAVGVHRLRYCGWRS